MSIYIYILFHDLICNWVKHDEKTYHFLRPKPAPAPSPAPRPQTGYGGGFGAPAPQQVGFHGYS